MNKKTVLYCIFLLCAPLLLVAQKPLSALETYLQLQGMENVSRQDSTIKCDLKYATTDNFTKTILYDSLFNTIYLHPLAAKKLLEAQRYLKKLHPELNLLVYDGVRPLSVQKKMYTVVQNTKYAAYVANPSRTGLHNYGMAVDLTICDQNGKPLDMGTPFDFFGRAAGTNKEAELLAAGLLTSRQVKNRRLLRKVMTSAGFLTISGEWWHFNAVSLGEARRSYKVVK
ncbi:M15 family metallopeptidase [Dysgonomonas sp. 511]|uniref:M15 family metallopeptidase n=1 Tax=Dysgonomonas sp. 511 TaxID=2302930 RepID=UPI0013D23464|nr:M15 family metallopeptidase [Dysgonomonas sp. 511]NDV78081.1 D-alanyl-D-alanine dipeptidase [Dysgonomonas sp. 511]